MAAYYNAKGELEEDQERGERRTRAPVTEGIQYRSTEVDKSCAFKGGISNESDQSVVQTPIPGVFYQ
jgi:hypothetical protein